MLYIISSADKLAVNLYKIGIHSGSDNALISRYSTYLINPILVRTYRGKSVDWLELEASIKCIFQRWRIMKNASGKLSEWFELNRTQLYLIEYFIASNGVGNEMTNGMTNVANGMTEKNERPYDIKQSYCDSFDMELVTVVQLQKLQQEGRIIYPEYQRPVDDSRARAIADYVKENFEDPDFIYPSIILNQVEQSGFVIYRIVDGQHRVKAIEYISANYLKKYPKVSDLKIFVVIKRNLTEVQEKNMFLTVNKSVPCPGLYLAEPQEKKLISGFEQFMKDKFGQQLSNSLRCITPNIHLPSLVDCLFNSHDSISIIKELYRDGKILSDTDLCDEFMRLNAYIEAKLGEDCKLEFYRRHCKRSGLLHTSDKLRDMIAAVHKKAIAAEKHTCYLGFIELPRLVSGIFAHNRIY